MNQLMPLFKNSLVEDPFFRDFFKSPKTMPAMDVRDLGDHYMVEADVPGFSKEDLTINYKDNVLTIQGEKQSQEEENKDGYFLQERTSSSFRRRVIIDGIEAEDIKGSLENGVLKLNLPKRQEKNDMGHTIALE